MQFEANYQAKKIIGLAKLNLKNPCDYQLTINELGRNC